MARTTISLPDSLAEQLHLTTRINVSEICRIALEARLANIKRIQDLAGNELERLIGRLKIEKHEGEQFCYNLGVEHGHGWAIHEASYDELVYYSKHERDFAEEKLPAHVESVLGSLERTADNQGKLYDPYAFKKGVLDAIADVWDFVKDKI